MRFSEITDVDSDKYPFAKSNQKTLDNLDVSTLSQLVDNEKYQIYNLKDNYYIFANNKNIGLMRLGPWEKGNTVLDVYVDPKYQKQGYGYILYKYLITQEQKIITGMNAQTPSSRNIWNHLFNDKSIKILGSSGPEGDYVDDIYFDGSVLQSKSVDRKSLILYASSN